MLQSSPWIEPLDIAASLSDSDITLLYSSTQASYSGRYSYLTFDVKERVEGNAFSDFSGVLSHQRTWYENAWFGYLGYGLKHDVESLPQDQLGNLELPDASMSRYHTILQFDHSKRDILAWSEREKLTLPAATPLSPVPAPQIRSIASNMSTAEYLEKVTKVIERIHAGELYQANITRKFFGHFATAPDAISLFKRLCKASPAAYSAYLRRGNTHILSVSPELFLHVDNNGSIRTRPIKGTSPRFEDKASDAISKQALERSAKDRAENLMIVDLMRHDLARTSIKGSVAVSSLFDVTSHANVHHMSSTVTAKKYPGLPTLDVVRYSFPPGSMTGAPKIRAMKVCSEMERQQRGIYSGAIGWLGGDGSCELSVVIRTLLVQGTYFEFQVGGGIVADSSPEAELKELLDKAGGILQTLGMTRDMLENC